MYPQWTATDSNPIAFQTHQTGECFHRLPNLGMQKVFAWPALPKFTPTIVVHLTHHVCMCLIEWLKHVTPLGGSIFLSVHLLAMLAGIQ